MQLCGLLLKVQTLRVTSGSITIVSMQIYMQYTIKDAELEPGRQKGQAAGAVVNTPRVLQESLQTINLWHSGHGRLLESSSFLSSTMRTLYLLYSECSSAILHNSMQNSTLRNFTTDLDLTTPRTFPALQGLHRLFRGGSRSPCVLTPTIGPPPMEGLTVSEKQLRRGAPIKADSPLVSGTFTLR